MASLQLVTRACPKPRTAWQGAEGGGAGGGGGKKQGVKMGC